MDKKTRNVLITSIVALVLILAGVTYAYFSARITGLESASTISLTAGRMGIEYSEGDENVIVNNIYPREAAWATKTFTLTGWNTTDQQMKYDLGLNVITNTFHDDYLTYDLTLVSSTNGTPISTVTNQVINGTGVKPLGTGIFTNANGDTHNYELKIYFKDNGLDQNDSQGAVFNARITIAENHQTASSSAAYFGYFSLDPQPDEDPVYGVQANNFADADIYEYGVVLKKTSRTVTLTPDYGYGTEDIVGYSFSYNNQTEEDELPYVCVNMDGTEVCANFLTTDEELAERCPVELSNTREDYSDPDDYVECGAQTSLGYVVIYLNTSHLYADINDHIVAAAWPDTPGTGTISLE